MKHNLHRFIFFVCIYFVVFTSAFSQQTNDLGDLSILKIKNDSAFIYLENVSIEVEIIGNRATTVTTLTFYNPNDRILEGELNFPLADKQRIFRFAMDLNGKLRESVVVEKELGRRAFEGTIRQKIDPALLEMTVGNNYKTRVYPIPAKGRKIILIGYEEELQDSKIPLYQLNLNYGKVKEFELKVEVINQTEKPIIKQTEFSNFDFEKWKNSYKINSKKENFDATGIFSFEIPTKINEQVFREKNSDTDTNNDFFYINIIPKVIQKRKRTPSSIAVLWDVSTSSKTRNTKKEIALLENYLEKITQKRRRKVPITFITFNNKIVSQNDFLINKSNFKQEITRIKNQLENIIYDGGTNLKAINFPNLQQDEILLFSDGISNLSHSIDAFPIKKDNPQTIYAIVSSRTNDMPFLNSLAQKTGGNYINLTYETQNEALEALLTQNYQFLGTKYKSEKMKEVYPIIPQTVQKDKVFSLAGQIKSDTQTKIKLKFGIGKRVLKTKRITIPKNYNSESISRIWANKKIDELALNSAQNKTKIIEVAKEYNLITPYTSLIVLDRIEDYVTYEISPPAELKEEYDKLMAKKKEKVISTEIEFIEDMLYDYEDKVEWWVENQKKVEPIKKTTIQTQQTNENNEKLEIKTEIKTEPKQNKVQNKSQSNRLKINRSNQINQENFIAIDTTKVKNYQRFIKVTGKVTDEYNEPLPFATITIKGTQIGKITDINGNYSIGCNQKDVLNFRFVGVSKEIRVGKQTTIDVQLQDKNLSEIVVTSFGVQSERRSLGYAIQEVRGEYTSSLQGNVAGVQFNSTSQTIIRGNSTITINLEPLYIINGIIVENKEYKEIEPDEIQVGYLLNGENAIAPYGNKGKNGVIFIITKTAAKQGYVLPDSTIKQLQIQQNQTQFVIKEWNPDEPYMDSIKNAPKQNRFQTYLSLKKEYAYNPSFFLIVGTYFIQNGEEEIGLQILSNIVELELENHELLKMLAYKYSQLGKMEIAIFLFEKIKELRPDEPHSTRDLALAHQKNGDYQKALDLMYEILVMDFDIDNRGRNSNNDLFDYFKATVLTEFNNLIALHKDELDVSKIYKKIDTELDEEDKELFFKNLPVDVRVVLDWNTLETDIDLWVIEPDGEKCYYGNDLTKNGGMLSEDLTDGYGAEEYLLKKAIKGEYIIKVDYFDDRVQKIAGATTLKVTVYFNYGSENQTQKEIVFQLEAGKEGEELEIGRFEWKK